MYRKLATYTGIALLKFFSVLPLPVLYFISDLMFPVVYHLIRYRRKVVRLNLGNAFPDKTGKELISIEKNYYRYLCDLLVETVRTRGMRPAEISRRMVYRNPELLNAECNSGRSVIVIAAHHGNWEWLLQMPVFLKHHIFYVYKPMQNAVFERFMNSVRARFGGETVCMSIVLRKLLDTGKTQTPVLTWHAADQTPPWNHPFWIDFMNQQTMFFNGPARLAQRFDQPVYFQQIRKIRRGYYETWFEPLALHPLELTEEEMVTLYVRKTEELIRAEPVLYLWSHRRWKYRIPGEPPVY